MATRSLRLSQALLSVLLLLATSAPALAVPPIHAPADLATLLRDSAPVEGVDGDSALAWADLGGGDDTLTVLDSTAVGDHLYLAGDFASADGVVHLDLVAIDMRTRTVDHSFVAWTNGRVDSIVPAADGTTLYLGGNFTRLNGTAARHLAAVDRRDGSRVPLPSEMTVDGHVRDLVVHGDRLWAAGDFTRAGGAERRVVAAWESGRLLRDFAVDWSWTPTERDFLTGTQGEGLTISPDGRDLYVNGRFNRDRATGRRITYGTAKVDAATGALAPGFEVADSPDQALIDSLGGYSAAFADRALQTALSDDGRIGVVAVGDRSYEGNRVHAFDTATGAGRWSVVTSGDPQTIEIIGDVVYVGGHFASDAAWGDTPPAELGDRMLRADRLGAIRLGSGLPVHSFQPGLNSAWGVWDVEETTWGLAVVGAFSHADGLAAPHVMVLHTDGAIGVGDGGGDDGDGGGEATCTAEAAGSDQAVVRWPTFNAEDDDYQLLVDGAWRRSVSSVDRVWRGDAAVGAVVTVRSREAGHLVDATCTVVGGDVVDNGDDGGGGGGGGGGDGGGGGGGGGDVDWCTVRRKGSTVTLTWSAVQDEDDAYLVRIDGRYTASVAADTERTWTGRARKGASIVIRSREDGRNRDVDCT